jgi:hypothetical protein
MLVVVSTTTVIIVTTIEYLSSNFNCFKELNYDFMRKYEILVDSDS